MSEIDKKLITFLAFIPQETKVIRKIKLNIALFTKNDLSQYLNLKKNVILSVIECTTILGVCVTV